MPDNVKQPSVRFSGYTGAWEQRKVSEIGTFSKGTGYSKSDIRDKGTPLILYGRLYTKYETVIREVDTFTTPKDGSVYSRGGEIIVPASGETAEDISIASVVEKAGVILGGDLNIITPQSGIDSAFLALSISHGEAHRSLSKLAQGKSVVHIHNSDIQTVEVGIPVQAEQESISQFFEKVDRLITLHQRKYDKLVNIKKSLLDKMFPRKGAVVPEVRFEGFADAWEQRKLGEVCDKFTDGDWIEAKDQSDSGIRLIQTGNVGIAEYIDKPNNQKWISKSTFNRLNCEEVLPGDILISRLPEPAGRACIMPYVGTRMITAVDCTIARTSTNISNLFLVQYLSSRRYFDEVNTCLAGGTRQRISRSNLADFIVPIPNKQAEQKAIGSLFKYIDTLITLHQRKLEKLRNIKKSFLEKMYI